MACLEDHEQSTWGEADQGARRVCRGARPALLLPSHAQVSAPSTGRPADLGIKTQGEERVAVIPAPGDLDGAPFSAPSSHRGPSRAAGGSTGLGCTRERLDSTERHEPQELVSARFQTDGSTYSNTYTAHTVKM